jgi:hypothetical protein
MRAPFKFGRFGLAINISTRTLLALQRPVKTGVTKLRAKSNLGAIIP